MRYDLKRIIRLLAVISLIAMLIIALSSCGSKPNNVTKKLQIISVKGEQNQNVTPSSLGAKSVVTIDIRGCGGGHIAAGPPDYIAVALKKIALTYVDDTNVTIWSNDTGYTVNIGGNGAVDLSGMGAISNIPAGTIKQVKLYLNPIAQIKGSLTNAEFFWDGLNLGLPGNSNIVPYLCTKAGYWFNTITGENTNPTTYGTFTSGDAGETNVTLSGQETYGDDQVFTTAVDATIAAGDNPLLTVLIDTSRLLRFWDGFAADDNLSYNPNHYAYFYSDGVFRESIACFIGDYGSIQGYQTDFTALCGVAETPSYVKGWMTVIFKPNGDFLSGMLVGDDDNAFCVSKGTITGFPDGTGALTYDLGSEVFTVSGFQKLTDYDDATTALNFTSTQLDDGIARHGTAIFTLKYSSN